jgi:putative thioredoxin
VSDSGPAIDVGPGEFDRRVVQESFQRPVVVDFWAEWCAPCRALGPVLERVVDSFGGRALLARVNIEQDQEAAVRYGVQSIPAVKVFRDGQIVTEFVGALPEPDVRRILEAVLPSPADELVAEGDERLTAGDAEAAEGLFRKALGQQADHPGATLRLASLALERGAEEEAREMLGRIDESADEHDAALALLARIEFGETCAAAGGRAACAERLAADGGDLDARHELACCLAADGDYARALEEFLAVVTADRGFRDGAAKQAMVRIFSLVGSRSELADAYRKRLASALY